MSGSDLVVVEAVNAEEEIGACWAEGARVVEEAIDVLAGGRVVVGDDCWVVVGDGGLVVVGGGRVVVGAAAAWEEPSQLIALELSEPPATWGFRLGVLLEGEPSPPNSTTAMT